MRIVLCYPATDAHLKQIRDVAGEHEVVLATQDTIPDEILDADIFCGHPKTSRPMPWDEVCRQGRLKWIQSSAAGIDHSLKPSVVASDILFTSASGLFADQVAEQTFALLFGVVRSLPVFFQQTTRKEFIRRPTGDVHRKTVGIIGFGGNGRRIAEVLAPFHVKTVAVDTFPENPMRGVELLGIDQLDMVLGQLDICILAMPLTAETNGMFNMERFAKVKPGCVLINVARGPVVVEKDMIAAMESGVLSAVGVDVTEVEPLPEVSPLWTMENVLITPHVGAQAADRNDTVTAFYCENLRRYLAGEPLLKLVDKPLGYTRPEDLALDWQPPWKR